MRGKIAKQLRRIGVTLGEEWCMYYAEPRPKLVTTKEGEVIEVNKPEIRLTPDCGRARYKQLKRNYLRIARGDQTALQVLRNIRGKNSAAAVRTS